MQSRLCNPKYSVECTLWWRKDGHCLVRLVVKSFFFFLTIHSANAVTLIMMFPEKRWEGFLRQIRRLPAHGNLNVVTTVTRSKHTQKSNDLREVWRWCERENQHRKYMVQRNRVNDHTGSSELNATFRTFHREKIFHNIMSL